jgi:hypothetical protein
MTVARIFKRCDCSDWDGCPHQWVVRREDIKALIAALHRKGLSASRIGCAHLVISAVLAEAVRDKKLAESPCSGIQLPGVIAAADFILPAHAQIEAVVAGLGCRRTGRPPCR